MSEPVTELMSLKDALSKHGFAVVQGKGTSMLPLIRNSRDRMCIKALTRAPKKYDILVYTNAHEIIAHRLLKTDGETLVMCGDNQITKEAIKNDAVLGYVQSIFRDDKCVELEKHGGYKLYCRLWCASLFLRRCALFVLRRVSKSYKYETKFARG
ncbi:MAG: hypothetical protein E7619_01485 [Ruminococcaceae bacterium]|nr:hypothetical protein [Oscillospiraceae bacterium]